MPATIDDTAARFLAASRRIPRLSREEEQTLALRWRDQRDQGAANVLILAHLREAAHIAYKHRHYGVPVCDLISEGNIGLMKALEKFDPDRGVRFSTYSAYWVRAEVMACVMRSSNMVRNRSGIVRTGLFFKLRRERARALALHHDPGSVNDVVAERLGATSDAVEQLYHRIDARDVSLDDSASSSDGASLVDCLSGGDDPEVLLAQRQVHHLLDAALADALAELGERERLVLESRLLAPEDQVVTLAELGEQLGISRERVRQIEARAREKLRTTLRERYGDCFDEGLSAIGAASTLAVTDLAVAA